MLTGLRSLFMLIYCASPRLAVIETFFRLSLWGLASTEVEGEMVRWEVAPIAKPLNQQRIVLPELLKASTHFAPYDQLHRCRDALWLILQRNRAAMPSVLERA